MNSVTFTPDLRQEKPYAMCTVDNAYARLGHCMEDAFQEGVFPTSFHDLCRRAGAAPADMREVLENELGMGPGELMDLYFGNGDKNY